MFHIIHALLEDLAFKSQVKYSIRQCRVNDKILEQGKSYSSFYLIKQGKVNVVINEEKGTKLKKGLSHLKENDIFGELALFDNLPANADVIAGSDVELIEIDISSFLQYLDNNPQVGYMVLLAILKSIVTRLRNANKSILTLHTFKEIYFK